ncbi:threonine aldolase family protein [Rubricoccus marinus]|uniref:Low specificity L-threonine aldolase n=1 Tax=Rubricoccus marinus TaxID=716817 RepID=A0A259U017_9BACT|nr:GntG family PLP-dependent aldolase [Rubricoccus marinus]OZC03164.1 low specificity L-threonine aldolase [Rubricoccus marinus]
MIDLRSDTVTRPTAAMRRAMAEAEVGDDVFAEDPTVRRLEERVADMLGKEHGVFVPSGVMGNQIAVRLHTRPGDEIIVPERAHLYHYEGGGAAALSGVQLRPIGDASGVLTPEAVEAVVQGEYDWEARSALVWLENTVNKAGGVVIPPEALREVAETARRHNLALHLDGARLWNAAVALNVDIADLAAPFDTVNVCLSKGLGAPVGSVLVGSAGAMRDARRVRKLFGGGMRQSGVLAAAALVALDDYEDNERAMLRADHRRARAFADALATRRGFRVIPPQSNIVLVDTPEAASGVIDTLSARGVRTVAFGPHTVRATFHRDISDEALDTAIDIVESSFS